jgi:ADP-dependent NAD(P)H-hydrate dehydratase / NAD(P)H-hydrate epimerase
MTMKLVTVSEMKAIEKAADANGVSYDEMMQRAGKGLADLVADQFEDDSSVHLAIGLVGSGNNGGDTLVALRGLADYGWTVKAYLTSRRSSDDPLLAAFAGTQFEAVFAGNDPDFLRLDEWLEVTDVLLDGVLGTGIKLPLKAEAARVLRHVSGQQLSALVVAVDCPSGVDCETGEMAAETIPADLTVCMDAVKIGLVRLPAFTRIGQLAVVDLGLPSEVTQDARARREVITAADVAAWLPRRTPDSHKGTFGTAMVVAGSLNYTGAAYLACRAAYRIGTGLVQAAVVRPLHNALAGSLPEVTWVILPDVMGVIAESAADVVIKNLGKATALLIGPGLGMEETTGTFMRRLFSDHAGGSRRGGMGFMAEVEAGKKVPSVTLPALVIDADGLKLLSKIETWWKSLPPETILTPHPGEMAVLTGMPVGEIQDDRMGVALHFAKQWNVIVILKGALSIVAAPDGQIAVIPFATSALAKAGTGDVLAGLITGLRAQGVPAFEAACAGAWIHAQAGITAISLTGAAASVLAGEVADAVPFVLQDL